MSIVSLEFFIFIGIVYVAYLFFTPRHRWMILFLASAYFMLCAVQQSVLLCCIFAAETLLTWYVALKIKRIKQERTKTLLIVAVITILVTVLVFYKDITFFVNNINVAARLLNSTIFLKMPEYAAPLGISYYTLILIGYLLDVHWGNIKEPQRNPFKFLLFAGYFPQMTSGPFTRYNDIADVIFGNIHCSLKQLQFGIQRMLWGLFKKLVLAERFSVMVSTIYDSEPQPLQENPYTGLVVVMGAFLYVAFLYMDFSGCMDIVIGVSEIFGIPLAENFCRPFTSGSLSEIWRKWHMTLGFWIKDYVLYPTLKSKLVSHIRDFCKKHFGKKASRTVPTYFGMFVTWFCVGFWHGGTWKYICCSGLFFFIMIVGGLMLDPLFQKIITVLKINTGTWSWSFFRRVRSFCLFSASVSIGRCNSLMDGLRAWKTVFTHWNPWVLFDDTIFRLGLDRKDFDVCVIGILVITVVSLLEEKHGSVRELIATQNTAFRWCLYLALFFSVLILGYYGPGYNPADFIYGGF